MEDNKNFKTDDIKTRVGIKEIWARLHISNLWKFSLKDFLFTVAVFIVLTIAAFFFGKHASDATLNIAMLYTLGVFIVSRYTDGYIYGFLFVLGAVLSVNFYFTFPYKDFNFSLQGYQFTFIGMLIIGVITSITSTIMKEQANALIDQEKLLAEQEKQLLEAEKEKMRANLLRAVSHDIRTPLTSIIGNADSYIEMGDSMSIEEKNKTVLAIGEDANWLLNMVENLLAVTRIDSENATVKKNDEVVDEVISAAISQFKKRFPEEEVKVLLPNEVFVCKMDAVLIQQVIINILQNAVMHAHSKEPLELFVTDDKDEIYIHIKDYGIGVPEDRLETIFDGEGLKTESAQADGYKGMGIGLSICKTIVLAHGGKIYCFNHGSGAEFVFSLSKEE